MLTRLKVSGFKNLVDVDVSFGAFTCIAGANGVGKSNLFDAIRFLSALADHSLIDAARMVRDDSGNNWDVRSLFHRVGNAFAKEMSFDVEMIIPKEGKDDITQTQVTATSTLLRYHLSLVYDASTNGGISHPLRILSERLTPIPRGEQNEILRFRKSKTWVDSVIQGRRTVPYISTPETTEQPIIHLHQDKQSGKAGGGRSFQHPAASLNRTVISLTNSGETPTALLARREMQSWRLLQLEPSALRQQDSFLSPAKLGANGAHLPATLFRLAHLDSPAQLDDPIEPKVYAKVANRLYQLLGEITQVRVDMDNKRDLLTLEIVDKNGTAFPAKSLSDGTLRFLALSVLAEDPDSVGVICFEEPENGIHPLRIPAILKLLKDIAVDTEEIVDDNNPLRQVIVNTHSPGVAGGVDDDDLLVAASADTIRQDERFQRIQFRALSNTWRSRISEATACSKGDLLAYLAPIRPSTKEDNSEPASNETAKGARIKTAPRSQRVVDRPEFSPLFDDLAEAP